MKKQGEKGITKIWRMRWFRLQGEKLLYFRSEESEELLGAIDLRNVTDVVVPSTSQKSFIFQLQTAGRSFLLSVEKQSHLDYWVSGIKAALDRIRSPSSSSASSSPSFLSHHRLDSPSNGLSKSLPPETSSSKDQIDPSSPSSDSPSPHSLDEIRSQIGALEAQLDIQESTPDDQLKRDEIRQQIRFLRGVLITSSPAPSSPSRVLPLASHSSDSLLSVSSSLSSSLSQISVDQSGDQKRSPSISSPSSSLQGSLGSSDQGLETAPKDVKLSDFV